MRTEGIPGFEECMVFLVWLPKRPRVIGCKTIFKEAGDVPWLKRVWCILVELLGVVGCKGKEKEQGGWWLNWHHHQLEVKVEKCCKLPLNLWCCETQNRAAVFWWCASILLAECMVSAEGKIMAPFCTDVTRFLDKVVVPWVVRINRGTIFSGGRDFCLSLCTI